MNTNVPIVEKTKVSQDAENLGLDYMSFGRWGKDGKVTHISDKGRLVPVKKQTKTTTPLQNQPVDNQQKISGEVPVKSTTTKKNPSYDELRNVARKHQYTVMTRTPLKSVGSTNPVDSRVNAIGKPGGFWFGVGTEWIDWTEGEMPDWKGENLYSVEVDEKQCVVIENERDLRLFHNEYRTPNGMIDWGKVAKKYKGIIIKNYIAEARMKYPWYYSWDVASGCVWDASALKEVEQQPIGEPPKPKPTPASDKTIMAKRIGPQAGSNPGGMFVGTDGIKRYVKKYKNPVQGYGENLANDLYNQLGISAPKSIVYKDDKGTMTFASEIIPNTTILGNNEINRDEARKVLDGFAADILMANWDAVGMEFDNIVFQKGNPNPIRIDNGAAFLTRAQGEFKPSDLLSKVTEYENFRDPDINETYAKIFELAGYSEQEWKTLFKKQVANIIKARKKYGSWQDYVMAFTKQNAPLTADIQKSSMAISKMLEARTIELAKIAKAL